MFYLKQNVVNNYWLWTLSKFKLLAQVSVWVLHPTTACLWNVVGSVPFVTKSWPHLQDISQMWKGISFYDCVQTSSLTRRIRAIQINVSNVTWEPTHWGTSSLPLGDDRRIKVNAWIEEVELISKAQKRKRHGWFLGTLQISPPHTESGSLEKWLTGCSGTSGWISHSKPQ